MFESMKIMLIQMLASASMGVVGNLKGDPLSDVREDIADIPDDNGSDGMTYYVDSNAGDDGNTGLSWALAMKTLTAAITASNLTIANHPDREGAGWAARNKIYYKGDANAETLTTLAQKTDIIGVGSGGGSRPYPQIVGVHAISAVAYSSCRFINMGFVPVANGDNTFTASGGQHGLAFIGCFFNAGSAIAAGSALVLTGNAGVKIEGCEFTGPYSDATIEILAGNNEGLHIKNNYIEGGNEGIGLATGVTSFPQNILIEDNDIRVATICINDVDKVATVRRNQMSTLQARGLHAAGAIIASLAFAVNNRITTSDAQNMEWPIPPTMNPSGGRDYYVDSNGGHDTDNSGSSWDDAFKTLTVAMAVSHANIALGNPTYAARNRIFYKGDANAETLTTLAQKTDIIGVGSGGGARSKPQIVGVHAISAVAYSACRFVNMGFVPVSNGDNTFTASGGQHGLSFIDCEFDAGSAIAAGSALVLTGNAGVRIQNCQFTGPYSDAVIEILAGNNEGLQIESNYIEGAEVGIELATGVTSFPKKILIKGNEITVATIGINDVDTTLAAIVDNGVTTLTTDGGAAGDNIIIGNKQISRGNIVCSSDATNVTWPVPVAIA